MLPRRHFLLGPLLGLLLGAPHAAPARPRPPYAVPGHERPVALLRAGRATYLVTQRSVFRLEGAQFVRKYQDPNLIQCAAAADTVLWLGTQHGALSLGTAGFRPHALALPGPAATASVTALFCDAQGALWAGANGYGTFRWAGGAFGPELDTPSVNAGLATADSAVWLATNVGLYRKRGPEWTRYNEEGVGNREIPDNIVEKLLPDNAGNLWVVMSDAICVLAAAGRPAAGEAELPTVKFLGRPGNDVYGVAHVPGVGRVFATAMGLLLLPAAPAGPLAGPAPATDKVEPQRLLVPLPALPGAGTAPPVLVQVDAQQRVWLASADAVTVLTAKQFRKFAQSAATNPRLASQP